MEEAAKTAKQSAESVSKGGERLGRTAAFKALSQVSWAALVPAGTRDSVPLPAPRSRVPISGLSPPSWVVLGKLWPLGSYGLPDRELQPVVSG